MQLDARSKSPSRITFPPGGADVSTKVYLCVIVSSGLERVHTNVALPWVIHGEV